MRKIWVRLLPAPLLVGGGILWGAGAVTPNPNPIVLGPPTAQGVANMSNSPLSDLEKNSANKNLRLNGRTKSIKLKLIIRRKDDPEIPPEYEWSTKPTVKGGASQVVYPYALLEEKTAGRATIRFRINREGRVDQTLMLEASKPEFGRAAQATVETLVFVPGRRKDGTPALVLCDADFEFKPDGKGDVVVTQQDKDLLKALKQNPAAVIPTSELDAAPRPINPAGPIYPTTLVKQGKAGSAQIEFLIDEDGWVVLPRVVSATVEEFGFAAAQAVSTWRFAPPTKKGRPVTTRARIEIEFAPAVKPPG